MAIPQTLFIDRHGQPPSWVLAELTPGKVSLGFRIGQADDLVYILHDELEPTVAVTMIRDHIIQKTSLENLKRLAVRQVELPVS